MFQGVVKDDMSDSSCRIEYENPMNEASPQYAVVPFAIVALAQ
jgi:hypothetical protein